MKEWIMSPNIMEEIGTIMRLVRESTEVKENLSSLPTKIISV